MIAIRDIAYVRYQVPDLDLQETFLTDFGLMRSARTANALYARAAGTSHHVYVAQRGAHPATVGFGLEAQTLADLQKLAAEMGSRVEDRDEPGGGQVVRLTDPAGFQVDVVFGREQVAPVPQRPPVALNPAASRVRLGQTVRIAPGPSSVARIGHVALLVPDFQASRAFYRDVLGMRESDTYWAGVEHNTIAAFMHCGLGQTWTDHHTVALIAAQDGKARFDHSSFEVVDLDDLMQGHAHLAAKGYRHGWGVGRHVQGSQLFDYWRDPFGHKIEHYTDGDLVNDASPVGQAPISNEELSQWAPPLQPEFFA